MSCFSFFGYQQLYINYFRKKIEVLQKSSRLPLAGLWRLALEAQCKFPHPSGLDQRSFWCVPFTFLFLLTENQVHEQGYLRFLMLREAYSKSNSTFWRRDSPGSSSLMHWSVATHTSCAMSSRVFPLPLHEKRKLYLLQKRSAHVVGHQYPRTESHSSPLEDGWCQPKACDGLVKDFPLRKQVLPKLCYLERALQVRACCGYLSLFNE